MRYTRSSIVITAFILCWGGIAFAQQGSRTDCSSLAGADQQKYAERVYEIFPTLAAAGKKEPVVFTKQDLETAQLHLRQYCCEEKSGEATCSGLPQSNNHYAHSPYLFDHLVNIGLRKMDGIEDHCDEMDIDCQWQDGSREHIEWRDEITRLAEDREGHPSYELEGNFREYWGQPGYYNEPEKLFSKYTKMCNELVTVLYALPDFNASQSAVNAAKQSGLLGTCVDVINGRYMREYEYVRALMVEKAILYQAQNLQSYVGEYFSRNRLRDLMDKYATLDGCFNMVLKYVRRTDCCNM